ncbi:MAG: hypothetical protein WCD35_16870 [Mycobacteriales bacterium]
MTATRQFHALVRALGLARDTAGVALDRLRDVLAAPDLLAHDAALHASGRPCQLLLQQLELVLEEARVFCDELGERPPGLPSVEAAHQSVAEGFASYRYHHEPEELAPRVQELVAALDDFERSLGVRH